MTGDPASDRTDQAHPRTTPAPLPAPPRHGDGEQVVDFPWRPAPKPIFRAPPPCITGPAKPGRNSPRLVTGTGVRHSPAKGRPPLGEILVAQGALSRDDRLDIEGGSAGAILALLALHRSTGSEAALAAARRCGEHLLSRQQPASPRGAAWPWKNGVCLLGYAHGTSGIIHALEELRRLAPDDRISEAVAKGLEYEDSWLDEELRNWPVLQAEAVEKARLPYLKAWCHGAPGVALGRLLVAAPSGDHSRQGENESLDAALETTASAQLLPVDHLCCGNLGHVAVLDEAARRLDRQTLGHASRQKLSAVVARAKSGSGYRLADGGAQSDPGLMRGLAGIGYELLRHTPRSRTASTPERLVPRGCGSLPMMVMSTTRQTRML